jgi:hypothetical protein
MIRYFSNGGGAAHHRIRIFEIGWRIGGAAFFTGVTILIGRFAFRALAFNKAIREEHFFYWIISLLDGALFN